MKSDVNYIAFDIVDAANKVTSVRQGRKNPTKTGFNARPKVGMGATKLMTVKGTMDNRAKTNTTKWSSSVATASIGPREPRDNPGGDGEPGLGDQHRRTGCPPNIGRAWRTSPT